MPLRCAQWSKASGFSFRSLCCSYRRGQPLAFGINRLASYLSQGGFCVYSRLVSWLGYSHFKYSENCFFKQYCSIIQMPDRAPFSAHSILKKSPPRKRKSMERRKRGEGGAPSPRGAGRIVRVTTQSERTHWYKATTHAERAISSRKKFAQRI